MHTQAAWNGRVYVLQRLRAEGSGTDDDDKSPHHFPAWIGVWSWGRCYWGESIGSLARCIISYRDNEQLELTSQKLYRPISSEVDKVAGTATTRGIAYVPLSGHQPTRPVALCISKGEADTLLL